MNEKFLQLYNYLNSNGMVEGMSAQDFYNSYSSGDNFNQLYGYLNSEGMTDLSSNDFQSTYFADQQVEDQQVEDQQVENQQVEDQQVEDPRQAKWRQVTEEEAVPVDQLYSQSDEFDPTFKAEDLDPEQLKKAQENLERLSKVESVPASEETMARFDEISLDIVRHGDKIYQLDSDNNRWNEVVVTEDWAKDPRRYYLDEQTGDFTIRDLTGSLITPVEDDEVISNLNTKFNTNIPLATRDMLPTIPGITPFTDFMGIKMPRVKKPTAEVELYSGYDEDTKGMKFRKNETNNVWESVDEKGVGTPVSLEVSKELNKRHGTNLGSVPEEPVEFGGEEDLRLLLNFDKNIDPKSVEEYKKVLKEANGKPVVFDFSQNKYVVKEKPENKLESYSVFDSIRPEGFNYLKDILNPVSNAFERKKSNIKQWEGTVKNFIYNNNIASLEEEEAIRLLRPQFERYGFRFEETDAGDGMIVSTSDGSRTQYINLDTDDYSQNIALQDFLIETAGPQAYGIDKTVLDETGAPLSYESLINKVESQISTFKKLLSGPSTKRPIRDQKGVRVRYENTKEPVAKAYGEYLNSEEYKTYLQAKKTAKQYERAKMRNLYDEVKADPSEGSAARKKVMAFLDDKYLSEFRTDYNVELNDLSLFEKHLISQYEDYSQQVKEFDLAKGSMTPEEASVRNEELNKFKKHLDTNKDKFLARKRTISEDIKRLEYLTGKYVVDKSKMGNIGSGLLNSFMDGVSSVYSTLQPWVRDNAMSEGRVKASSLTKEEEKRYRAQGLNSEDEIANAIGQEIYKEFKEKNANDLKISLGDMGVSKEYMESEDRGFVTKALFGVAQSLPAMLTSAMGTPASLTALSAQAFSAIEDEMLNDPDFKGESLSDIGLIAVPYAMGMGVLEKIGLSTALSKNPAAKSLILKSISSTIKKIGGSGSKDLMEKVLEKEIKSNIAKFGLRVAGGFLAEAETGATQSLVLDIGYKELINQIKGNDRLASELTGGELFDTPDSVQEGILQVVEDGIAEGIGGIVMTGAATASQGLINGNISLYNTEDVEFLKSTTTDHNIRKSLIAKLKADMLGGRITKSEAQKQLDAVDKVSNIFKSVPENLSEDQQVQAVNLIAEKQRLQQEMEGKDESLVAAQKQRISDIDNELKKLSEDAFQKQTTGEVPVQPEATVGEEVEGREPQAEPQVVTEESKEEVADIERRRQEELNQYDEEGLKEIYEVGSDQTVEEVINAKYDAELSEIQQPVLTEEVKIEETVSPTKNLVTKENVEELRAKQTTREGQKVMTAAKMVLNALPDTKVYVHETTAEYEDAIKQKSIEGDRGAFVPSKNEIHINLQNGGNVVTLFHESMHSALQSKGMQTGAILDMAKGLQSIVSDKDLKARLSDFISQYDSNEQAEEYLAELGAIMSEAKQELTTTKFQRFKALLGRIFKKLGLPARMVPFANAMNAVESAAFMNNLTRQLRTGEQVVSEGEAINVNTEDLSIKKRKVGAFEVSYFEDESRFFDLVKEELVESNYDIANIAGEVVAVHQPDNMFVGNLNYKGENKFKGNGGVFYTLESGNVWASGKESSAKQLTNLINKSFKESTDGVGRLVLVRGVDSKMISSVEGVKASMAIIELMVDEGLISRSDFRSSLIRVGKKFNIDFSGKNSAAAIHKDIKDKFMDVENSTFERRGDFFNQVIDDLGKTSKSVQENIKGIREFLGSERKISFSVEGVRDSIGNILTERLLLGLPKSHVYAVIEVTELVTYEKQEGNESYPWVLKSGSQHKLKLLSERPNAVKGNVFEMTDGSAPTYGKLGLSQRGMGIARVAPQEQQQPEKLKKQIIGENAKLSQKVRDDLAYAKMEQEIMDDTGKFKWMDLSRVKKFTPELLKELTGWEKGADGKWKYEIQDGNLKEVENGTYKLSEIYDAPELYEAYPDAKNIPVSIDVRKDGMENSWFMPDTNSIEINVKSYNRVIQDLIHELQHYVQFKEGFAIGGNTQTFMDNPELSADLIDEKRELIKKNEMFRALSFAVELYMEDFPNVSLDKFFSKEFLLENNMVDEQHKETLINAGIEIDESIESMIEDFYNFDLSDMDRRKMKIAKRDGDFFDVLDVISEIGSPIKESLSKLSLHSLYERLSGEVEARNATERRLLSEVNKRKKTLQSTEDVAREDQILFFDKQPAEKLKKQKAPSIKRQKGEKLTEPVAGNKLFNEPLKQAEDIAKTYMKSAGMEYIPVEKITELDKDLSKRIATAYDQMENNPNDPKVKAAYDALMKETIAQYDAIIDAGYQIEINNTEPYSNSQELISDLKDNKRMRMYSSEAGFGDTPITDKQRSESILLQDSGKTDINGEKLLNNDIFRFVHDFFGHAKLGNSFGPIGEENAWRVHAVMYSPEARKALTSETRGQNSWVNFSGVNDEVFKKRDRARELRKQGKVEEANRLVDEVYEDMKFAEQKIGLLPDFATEERAPSIKKQKGQTTRQQAIQKAKEKYELSVEKRGNSHDQGVSAALGDLKKSDWYKNADDTAREDAVREIEKFFGAKLKKAPSAKKITGAPKRTKVTVDEAAALKDQIKKEAKAAREAKKDLNEKRKGIAAVVKKMVKSGKITEKQAASIVAQSNIVNLDNPEAVQRFLDYVGRVFEDANYREKLLEANKKKKSIRRAVKTNNQAEVIGMAKNFLNVDPSMAEDIDEYLEIAEKVYNAVRPSRVKDASVIYKEAANIGDINEYTQQQIKIQEDNYKKMLIAQYNDLKEAGLISERMDIKELVDTINMLKDPNESTDNTERVRKAVITRLDSMIGVLNNILQNKINPITGEDIDISEKDQKILKAVANMELENLDIRSLIYLTEALENYFVNGITSGLEANVKSYIGVVKANILFSSIKGTKSVNSISAEQILSLPLLIERIFRSPDIASKFMQDSGLMDIINGKNKAETTYNLLLSQYAKQDFYKRKDFMAEDNMYERGMLAFLMRNVSGNQEQMKAETQRRINAIKESIDNLSKSKDSDLKDKAKKYQEVADKLNLDSNDIDVIISNASKMNEDAVNWWINQWQQHYQDLYDISLSVYNTKLSSDVNYTPDNIKKTDTVSSEIDSESSFISSLGYVDTRKTGVLMENQRALPKDGYVDLSFEMNNAKSLRSALVDINTAGAIRQTKAFLETKAYKDAMPDTKTRNILNKRISNYISRSKGKQVDQKDSFKKLEKTFNALAKFGTVKALGGIFSAPKQLTPIVNTLINSGRLDIVTYPQWKWMSQLGMGISNRGAEADAAITMMDRRISKLAEGIGKVADPFSKVGDFWINVAIKYPDAIAARSSFISYYKRYLERNGINVNDIDWSTHEVNQEAADYAQLQVDRQQNISDPLLAGELWLSEKTFNRFITRLLMPFTSFIWNQRARSMNDLLTLTSNLSSKEEKLKAGFSLTALPIELAVFQAIGMAGRYAIEKITDLIFGEEDDDEEKIEFDTIFGKIDEETFRLFSTPLRSFAVDLLSPLPGLTDDMTIWAINKYGFEKFPMLSDESIDELVDEENKIRLASGKNKLEGKELDDFIEKIKEERTFTLFESRNKNGLLENLSIGSPGILFKTVSELDDMYTAWKTGEIITESFGKEKTKYLNEEDRSDLGYAILLKAIYGSGILPREAGTIADKAFRRMKKNAVSESLHEKQGELKKTIGRDPNELELLLLEKGTKPKNIKEESNYINKMLDEDQVKEYIKVRSKVQNVSDKVKGYIARNIAAGLTAEQVIDKLAEIRGKK